MTKTAWPAKNVQCFVTLDFADGRYLFKLPRAQAEELQNKCGVKTNHPLYGEMLVPTGLGAIYAALLRGAYRQDDGTFICLADDAGFNTAMIVETIRLGLIGGNHGEIDGQTIKVDPVAALRLVNDYVIGRPLSEGWKMALAILGARIEGIEVEPEEAPEPTAQAA